MDWKCFSLMDKQMDFHWWRVIVKQSSLYVKYNVFYSKMYFKVSFRKGIVELQHACAAAALFIHSYLVSFKLSDLKWELTLRQNHILIVLPIELFIHIYLLCVTIHKISAAPCLSRDHIPVNKDNPLTYFLSTKLHCFTAHEKTCIYSWTRWNQYWQLLSLAVKSASLVS